MVDQRDPGQHSGLEGAFDRSEPPEILRNRILVRQGVEIGEGEAHDRRQRAHHATSSGSSSLFERVVEDRPFGRYGFPSDRVEESRLSGSLPARHQMKSRSETTAQIRIDRAQPQRDRTDLFFDSRHESLFEGTHSISRQSGPIGFKVNSKDRGYRRWCCKAAGAGEEGQQLLPHRSPPRAAGPRGRVGLLSTGIPRIRSGRRYSHVTDSLLLDTGFGSARAGLWPIIGCCFCNFPFPDLIREESGYDPVEIVGYLVFTGSKRKGGATLVAVLDLIHAPHMFDVGTAAPGRPWRHGNATSRRNEGCLKRRDRAEIRRGP